MKKFLLLVSVFLFCSVAEAQQVEVTTARKVAENWSHNVVGVKNNVDLQLVMTDEDEIHSTVYYYIFNDYNNNGFVIVAGDERIEPI
ncbi:MAG: Spi family protease inhibitor, partial [Bacteroidales bacterium]|nr:Spi family protease inhibitor [Bacteroidales bacterium]